MRRRSSVRFRGFLSRTLVRGGGCLLIIRSYGLVDRRRGLRRLQSQALFDGVKRARAQEPRIAVGTPLQEAQDRAFNYLSEYLVADNKFVRLSDDALRTVNLVGHDHFAYGIDTREYDQPMSYNGRRYEDVYGVDLATGERKPLLKKHIASQLLPSPNGKSILFWGDDAQWWIVDVASGQKRELTKGVPSMFADTSDDHNNLVAPPVAPRLSAAMIAAV